MRPNNHLITALFQTADYIEEYPNLHDWTNSAHCNCGILANFLLDDRPITEDNSPDGSWTFAAHEYIHGERVCTTSGLPLNTIMSRLIRAGLDIEDFERIEFIEEGNWDSFYEEEPWKDPRKVAAYLRRKAEELQVQLAVVSPRIYHIDSVPVRVC